MALNEQSRIKEIYENPVGHDILARVLLQMGKDEKLLHNPIVANMKLKTVKRLAKDKLDDSFFETFLKMLNSETQRPFPDDAPCKHAWWKEAVFYQIYPRSFMDSNKDGIGDLNGILSKLDYLKELGVNCLWLSPVYDSPNDDNGYDIRDYQKIMEEFGTLEDFDHLLDEVHARDMKLIMDLVVNHTSDEHPWFKKALSDPGSKERKYYFIKEGKQTQAPNNWTSFFSGSAWNYYDNEKIWALHLFSKKQMDLNWDNPDVRKEVSDLVTWWLKKGVDGFRMDVINYISKQESLPDGDESVGGMMGFTGIEHYFYGPHLHEYLHELKETAFEPYEAFSVGETPGIGLQMGKLLTQDDRKELDMIFNFDQLETPGHVRFDRYQYDLNYYKSYIMQWMKQYGARCQMSLFYENHDNPRMISKINPNPNYRNPIAKLLALMQLTLKGTPFIFQGQELGMINQKFSEIGQLRDIESLNLYKELIKTMSRHEAFLKILAGTRDHARTPMQWDESINGGFTKGTPWIWQDDDYKRCNAKQQRMDENSVFRFYQQLIELRQKSDAFTYGSLTFEHETAKNLFTYTRTSTDGRKIYYIECNLSDGLQKRLKLPHGATLCMSNYQNLDEKSMKPYEANLYRIIDMK